MITFPNAKINLGLNVVEKRPDGYHNLETVFYPIKLQDALEVNRLEGSDLPYKIHTSGTVIEGNLEDNLVIKAYNLLKAENYQMLPVDIHLFKHIPTGAGLGGGSADAAFMIKLLNEKFKLGISEEKMEEYAARLGADCAFFIKNKPVFASGIGNIFEPIEISLKGYYLVLVKPNIFVSTRDAFACIKPQHPEVSLKEIIKRPIETWKDCMKNDFEYSVFQKYPEIAAIKDKLYDLGVRISTLTWNFPNELGFPNPAQEEGKPYLPDLENGLTPTGIAFVEEMERLGIVIDLSHLNDAGIRDVFAHTRGPVIASHSNARGACFHLRNLSDEMIRQLAERGGVTGINFCPSFLREEEPAAKKASTMDMVRHMKYLRNVGGIDIIGLGTDLTVSAVKRMCRTPRICSISQM